MWALFGHPCSSCTHEAAARLLDHEPSPEERAEFLREHGAVCLALYVVPFPAINGRAVTVKEFTF